MGALILGCTHYPIIRRTIRQVMGPDIALIDSGREAALALAEPERAEACQKRKDDFYKAYREGAARYRTEQDDML